MVVGHEIIYMSWLQRCGKDFQGSCFSSVQTARLITFNVSNKVSDVAKQFLML